MLTHEELDSLKLSELVKIALPHMKAYQEMVDAGQAVWDMDVWLQQKDDYDIDLFSDWDKEYGSHINCAACEAGAVMYGMKLQRDKYSLHDWQCRIDRFRRGWLFDDDTQRMCKLSRETRDRVRKLQELLWAPRANDAERFKLYRDVADELEELGL